MVCRMHGSIKTARIESFGRSSVLGVERVYVLRRVHWEALALAVVLLVFAVLCLGAFFTARAQVRDDLRLADLTNLKRSLEVYYNIHEFYVAPPSNDPMCTSSVEDTSWLFGGSSPLLGDGVMDAVPHDVRESQTRKYVYCVTSFENGRADGYYLQATMERDRPEGIVFDEDEQRKFHYRVLHESGETLLRICGGEELQCFPYGKKPS